MALIRRTTKTDPAPSPEQPRIERIEDDAEYQAFDRRFAALTDRKAAIVARQLKLEALHPRTEAPSRVDPEVFERAARDRLANPPSEHSALPTTLRQLLDEKRLITRALELAQDEGRRVSLAALDRVRKAREPEWRDATRQVALAAHALEMALKTRDRLFSEIGFGPLGRQDLPLSGFRVTVQAGSAGAYPLNEIVRAAIDNGYIEKGDITE
jgi:hypothetical protein